MNPRYGDFDPYDMAASAIDEAIRNCVAVGADPARIAILDNFCWGDCERNETLGSLVRAALACHDFSLLFETPFISGKDSLNNEFSYVDPAGERQTIAIPPTLLISALGQIDDVRRAVTMDLKQAGNLLYVVGETWDELGGSHFSLVNDLQGGRAPSVRGEVARAAFSAIHTATRRALVSACHDLSEGGLAVAVAEMALAGGLGASLQLDAVPTKTSNEGGPAPDAALLLFSESNSRFLCEVTPANADAFETSMQNAAFARVGEVGEQPRVTITAQQQSAAVIDVSVADAKQAWQAPLAW
ncbi:AIR synthase-related protein [Pirellulales bacterium]|nr:AIR synthase-related protein [Pirellulales bacterium]